MTTNKVTQEQRNNAIASSINAYNNAPDRKTKIDPPNTEVGKIIEKHYSGGVFSALKGFVNGILNPNR